MAYIIRYTVYVVYVYRTLYGIHVGVDSTTYSVRRTLYGVQCTGYSGTGTVVRQARVALYYVTRTRRRRYPSVLHNNGSISLHLSPRESSFHLPPLSAIISARISLPVTCLS